MVYIILQRKKISQDNLKHIGVKRTLTGGEPTVWTPLCQKNKVNPSKCEYQYKAPISAIECKDCLKVHKKEKS